MSLAGRPTVRQVANGPIRDFSPSASSYSRSAVGERDTHVLFAQVDFSGGISDAWATIAEFVPKLVVALLILVIGWFIAKLIRTAVTRVLQAVKFDALVDRSGLGGPLERAGYADSGRLLAQLVYWMVMLMVIQYALSPFGDNPISDLLDSFVAFIPKIFVAVILIFITGAVANFVKDFIAGTMSTQSYGGTLASVAAAAVWMIGIFAALDQVQVASGIVDTLFTTIMGSLGLILVIKFGVGGIAGARDRFWPKVYDTFDK